MLESTQPNPGLRDRRAAPIVHLAQQPRRRVVSVVAAMFVLPPLSRSSPTGRIRPEGGINMCTCMQVGFPLAWTSWHDGTGCRGESRKIILSIHHTTRNDFPGGNTLDSKCAFSMPCHGSPSMEDMALQAVLPPEWFGHPAMACALPGVTRMTIRQNGERSRRGRREDTRPSDVE